MAGSTYNACWDSNLELHSQNGDAESLKSLLEEDDNPNEASVGSFMRSLFEKQLYTDVNFVSQNGKESLSAHRAVLAAKCKKFETLLFGDRVNGAIGMKLEVEMKNMEFDVFKDIVKYFYTGDIYFHNDSFVLETYAIAQSFEIQLLTNRCEKYIDALELTEDNVCSTLQVSTEKNAEILKDRCIDYIKRNTSQVISSPDFEKCSFNTVREICNLQGLNLESEARLLEASVRWINVQPDHAKKELKESLMKCIRFLSMSRRDFSDVVRRYPDILTSQDALAVLMYLNDPNSNSVKDLPDWVNRGHRHFKRVPQEVHKKIKIPLQPALGPQDFTKLTSVLQMKCIRGVHKINAVKFSVQDISNERNISATIVIKTQVFPKRHELSFMKSIDSKETIIAFDRGIFVGGGQTFRLKVEMISCQSCKFLQFENSENSFVNEHFQCSVTSIPSKGRFFFIDEVEYGPHVRRAKFFRGNR